MTDTIKSLKKELDEFKTDVGGKFDTVKNLLEEIVNKDTKQNEERSVTPANVEVIDKEKAPEATVEAPKAQNVPLTPEQTLIFEKYFDPEDGFTAEYNIDESVFIINVPLNLSNADDAYKKYYKKDVRVKKVDQNNITGSMEEYCKLVTKQLNYNRKIRVKL